MALVIDTERSEVGTQRRRDRFNRPLHCCCICGTLDRWRDSWSAYYSEADIDNNEAIPKFCSAECKSKGGPVARLVTEAMRVAAQQAEYREPRLVYREQTEQEKYRSAAADQQRRNRLRPTDTGSMT